MTVMESVKMVSVGPMPFRGTATMRMQWFSRERTLRDLGAGERILGVATRKYQADWIHGSRLTLGTRLCVFESPVSFEYRTTSDAALTAAMRRAMAVTTALLQASSFTIDIAQALEQNSPPGATLRSISRQPITPKDGPRRVVVSSMETTEYVEGPVDV